MTRIIFSAAGKKANRMACMKGLAHIHDLNAVGRSGGNLGMCQVKNFHTCKKISVSKIVMSLSLCSRLLRTVLESFPGHYVYLCMIIFL